LIRKFETEEISLKENINKEDFIKRKQQQKGTNYLEMIRRQDERWENKRVLRIKL
jgi:hypothetical protein